MMNRRIQYENILNNALKELIEEKDKLLKHRENIQAEYKKILATDINESINIINNKINDIMTDLAFVKQDTIDSMKELLIKKEKERIYHSEIAKSICNLNNISLSKFINGKLLDLENSLREQSNKIAIDIELIKEDINKMILMEILGVKVYDIEKAFISHKDKKNCNRNEFLNVEGFFFVCLDDNKVLVFIKEDEVDIPNLELEYKKKISYKGRTVYIDVENDIKE